MGKIRILHNGGGWITNIGNAFLDLGSIESLRRACPEAEIYLTSVTNRWISYHINRKIIRCVFQKRTVNVLDLQNFLSADYVVQSGAFLGKDWFDVHGDLLLKLINKGVKLIINGGGATDAAYTDEQIEKTRKYLRKLKPYVFISRDEKAFESFGDLAEYSYNGIDCAFFISEAYKPPTLDIPSYIILNFDKQPEPSLKELGIKNEKYIIRIHHSFWHSFPLLDYIKMMREYYYKENILISEIPYDYLTLYANTDATYSDRVHACVVTLSYGKSARLFCDTPRALLLERIGIKKITKELTKPNINKIKKEKEKQIAFLSEILGEK